MCIEISPNDVVGEFGEVFEVGRVGVWALFFSWNVNVCQVEVLAFNCD